MFDTYTNIFDQRGKLYHQAMLEFPLARKEEFEAALASLKLKPNSLLCDAPAGGGYLQDFITTPDIKTYSVETSKAFVREINDTPANMTVLCQGITQIPVPDKIVQYVLSLAGLHHVENQRSFYQEAHRILEYQGILLVADVYKQSGVDKFLNGFVDSHSSMGHRGDFISAQSGSEIEASGFQIQCLETKSYQWNFPTLTASNRP